MSKKILVEIKTENINLYLQNRNKLVGKNEININDKQEIKNLLGEYYKMGYKKVFIVIHNNTPHYKVLVVEKVRKKEIESLVKINVLKNFMLSSENYYFSWDLLSNVEDKLKVLVVLGNKNFIEDITSLFIGKKYKVECISTFIVEFLNKFDCSNLNRCIIQIEDFLYFMYFSNGNLKSLNKIDLFDKESLRGEISNIKYDEKVDIINVISEEVYEILQSEGIDNKNLNQSYFNLFSISD